jgi:hypothetical protein
VFLIYDDRVPPSAAPIAYLYHVVALANGTQSFPGPLDYATTATTLFAESIVAGVTPVRGIHVLELRTAIDALRSTAGLSPYGPPAFTEGWPAHSPDGGAHFVHSSGCHAPGY